MKYNIKFYITLFLITFPPLSCSKQKHAPESLGENAAMIDGQFRFLPSLAFYPDTNAGEIIFETSKRHERTYFRMAVAGMTRSGSIRIRVYNGRAYRIGERIELRAGDCFLFGKRKYDHRLSPIENWNCGHLVFAFRSGSGELESISDERTSRSEWFGPIRARPVTDLKGAFFAGQVFALLEDGRLTVYAYRASKLLRNGQRLSLHDSHNQPVGMATVEERIGDIVIVRAERPFMKESLPLIAYTTKKPDYGGLFE
jgi:hypothetical protein